MLPSSWMFEVTSRTCLICYVPYGFKVAKSYQAHFNLALHNISWRIFCETEWHHSQFVKLGRRAASNVVVSGYPKFDAFRPDWQPINPCIREITRSKFTKIIIWAPHWSIQDKSLGYSTFDLYFEKFQSLVEKHRDIFWAFKPHQRLKYHLRVTGFMGKTEIASYFEFWKLGANTGMFDDGDYFDLFKNSNALITDSGSFLAEYLPSGKPVLLLNSRTTVGYNEFGKKLVDQYYSANDWQGVETFVNDVIINEKDGMRQGRTDLIPLVMPRKGKKVGRFISENIESSILGSEIGI